MRRKNVVSWIAVADSAKAKIYENIGPKLSPRLIDELDSALARQKTHEIMSDKRGRTTNSAMNGRTAMEAPSDPQDIEKHKFVKHLADYLETVAEHDSFDELIIVAAPRTLGEFRKLAGTKTKDYLKTELDKDLTNVSPHDLAGHLDGLGIGKPPLS